MAFLNYTETELDPAVQAEILVESARNEARVAILEIVLAVLFGGTLGFSDDRFQWITYFVLATVVPLLADAFMRQSAARTLRGIGPQPKT